MMGWYGNGTGALGWLGMGVFWLILLGLIVWLVARLLPGSGGAIDEQVFETQPLPSVQDAPPVARRDRA